MVHWQSELTITWTPRWIFFLLKSGLPLLVLWELIVLNPFSSGEETEVSVSLMTCPSFITATRQGQSKTRPLASQIIFLLPSVTSFRHFWWVMIQEVKCSRTCQMYSESRKEGTGFNTSGQAVSVTRNPGFTAFGQAQFHPWEEEGQPKVLPSWDNGTVVSKELWLYGAF